MAAEHSSLKSLVQSFERTSYFKKLQLLLEAGGTLSTKSLRGSLKALTANSVQRCTDKRLVVVCSNEDLSAWYHDIALMASHSGVAMFSEGAPRRSSLDHHADDMTRIVDVVSTIEQYEHSIVVADPASFLVALPKPTAVVENIFHVKRDDSLSFEQFCQHLQLNGFERQDYVSKPGEIAIRGGIVDVFPVGWSTPLRIEFWGDLVDSIREFDPLSQRSIREHQSVEFLARFISDEHDEFSCTLMDYIDNDTIIILDQPETLAAQFEKLERHELFEQLQQQRCLRINPLGSVDLETKSTEQKVVDSSVESLYLELTRLQQLKSDIFICAEGSIHTRRMRELTENVAERMENDHPEAELLRIDAIHWEHSTPHAGFEWPDESRVVFTEHQIFNRQRFHDARKYSNTAGLTLRELQQLRKGDLIIHIDKGVGQFDGLETITIGGNKQESVRLLFAEGDVLYVHLNYINKLQRYSAAEGTAPKLSKLGTGEWERKKARTKKKIKDIARDLIKLYAQRKALRGFAFPSDTVWQKEFEASFMYEDTPDQAKATAEVKADMETSMPMDRLVCGDVGFGKTEIAIRAAFKAAQAGKQVAVLVPTTILAQQHYLTFSERLRRYPVRVDVISRFRSSDEQKAIAAKMEEGAIDVLIGTHRILSKDIVFRNLGLLVIDEEQRFGVAAKEKLRSLRANVDTLTLTATPIPRTLNFSLMGARDLSIIETPPRNRLPVETSITEWNDHALREAISRELDRGGQLYFVNDTIQDLDELAMRLTELMPGIKFGIAHGQMDNGKLETVMERFLERKFDVLLTTKIVESGLDIPNVNTIIINRADRFGLAELYQLRGRVGRSNKQAYCYLVVPPIKTLQRNSIRRLQAIEEHTDLGSGFHLAMRDLEIRGAGNLLGGEQSGFIAELGLETYQRILDEAVRELRHEEFADMFDEADLLNFTNDDVSVELDADALLPEAYVKRDTERFEFYKRLFNARTEKVLEDIHGELRDRYGALPPEAENLLYVVRVRLSALPAGFDRIMISRNLVSIELPLNAPEQYFESVFPRIVAHVSLHEGSRFVQKNKRTVIEIPIERRDDALPLIRSLGLEVLQAIDQAQQERQKAQRAAMNATASKHRTDSDNSSTHT